MMRKFYVWIFVVILLAVTSVPGCGNKKGRVSVSGEVTYEGQPIVEGLIHFQPHGNDAPVVSEPIKNGQYNTDASGGVMPGEYTVEICAYNPGDPVPEGPGAPPRRQLLPAKYNVESGLKLDIKSGEKKLLKDFVLTK